MTDRQIITKDVDARGCKLFRNGICASPINPKCKLCAEISEKMCYYKQLKRKEQECEELKKDKFALELRLDELTSPVNVEDCEHSVFNGEYIACRYYEGQRCDDADFANCMFRENVRLKQELDQLKANNEELKKFHINLVGVKECDIRELLKLKQTLTEIKEIAKI